MLFDEVCSGKNRAILHASNAVARKHGKKKKRKEQKEENWRELRDFYRCNNFHEMDDSSVSNFR